MFSNLAKCKELLVYECFGVLECDIGRQLILVTCTSLYTGDYIEKLDNTFIYPPHLISKPMQ